MAITGQWPYGHIVKNGHNRILHLAIIAKNIGVSYIGILQIHVWEKFNVNIIINTRDVLYVRGNLSSILGLR